MIISCFYVFLFIISKQTSSSQLISISNRNDAISLSLFGHYGSSSLLHTVLHILLCPSLFFFFIQSIDCFLWKMWIAYPHPLFSCNSLKRLWSFPCTQSCTCREREREREREIDIIKYIYSIYVSKDIQENNNKHNHT